MARRGGFPRENQRALEWLDEAIIAERSNGVDLAFGWLSVVLLNLILDIVSLRQGLLQSRAAELSQAVVPVGVEERVVDYRAVSQSHKFTFLVSLLLARSLEAKIWQISFVNDFDVRWRASKARERRRRERLSVRFRELNSV